MARNGRPKRAPHPTDSGGAWGFSPKENTFPANMAHLICPSSISELLQVASFFCVGLPNFAFWNAVAPEPAFAAHKIWASAPERKNRKAPFGAARNSFRKLAFLRARLGTFEIFSKGSLFPVDTQE